MQGQPSDVVQIAPYQICKDMTHLDAVCQDILDGGGEGIILRDPSSSQTSGRCAGFLKHKVSLAPRDALLTEDLEISGRRSEGDRNSGQLPMGV